MAAKSKDPFVKVPLWWAEAAAKATRTPGFLVCIELLRASWKAKSLTFSASNKRLAKAGEKPVRIGETISHAGGEPVQTAGSLKL